MRTVNTVVAVVLGLGCALAHAQATPVGLWKQIDDVTHQEKSLVRITESGGSLAGRIEKILDPARAAALCEQCAGELKNRPMLGLVIIQGARQDETDKTRWDGGQILDPNNGKTYRLRLTTGDDGKSLAVRGYVGAPLLGRTQTWVRVE